ncbi:MAG: hypothetical protein HC866_04030 [Leptolyngbyaceae cyanobacterium RU_5_1]|nr:hypothetical protein [Leptolyngbyaceae cyanobacterium RU_5_1]
MSPTLKYTIAAKTIQTLPTTKVITSGNSLPTIRLLLVDDHVVLRQTLAIALSQDIHPISNFAQSTILRS